MRTAANPYAHADGYPFTNGPVGTNGYPFTNGPVGTNGYPFTTGPDGANRYYCSYADISSYCNANARTHIYSYGAANTYTDTEIPSL